MVRVCEGFVLGNTPETIEFRRSTEPVPIRFELEGYIPVTRAVSAVEDGELWIALEPLPKGRHPATEKSKGSRGH